ncbi:MAG TPA: hypothetical protein VE684_19445 [Crenalkalicoccus sp.]|nr:hypothetical protein [Crenalkalicoccus sp.]
MAELIDLLLPLLPYADFIEAALPNEEARAKWRRVVAHARHEGKGRKPNDNQQLLLAMAELELDGSDGDSGALAKAVIDRYPRTKGAGLDNRPHVGLPRGRNPGRADLIDSLIEQYDQRRPALLRMVSAAREQAPRMQRSVDQLHASGAAKRLGSADWFRKLDPAARQRLEEAARRLNQNLPSAYEVDRVLDTVRDDRRRKSGQGD